jgi:hypothetical protein
MPVLPHCEAKVLPSDREVGAQHAARQVGSAALLVDERQVVRSLPPHAGTRPMLGAAEHIVLGLSFVVSRPSATQGSSCACLPIGLELDTPPAACAPAAACPSVQCCTAPEGALVQRDGQVQQAQLVSCAPHVVRRFLPGIDS